MSERKVILHKREFLNGDSGMAAMEVEVVVEPWTAGWWREITLSLSDCSRTINLDFDVDSKDSLEESVRKIDKIIDNCTLFKSAMIEAAKLYQDKEEEE